MKKIFTILSTVLYTTIMLAQAPQKMSYQAVIRNNSNALVISSAVGMRISILQGSASGTVIYKEIYNPNPITNANGLASLEIGSGIALIGSFTSINWANGPLFLKTETDPNGGTNYTIIGTSQLLSVPYALYAATSGSTPILIAPTVTSNSATNIAVSSVTLNGSVNANGFISAVQFEYGISTSYGNLVSSTPNTVTGNTNTAVMKNLTGLIGNTTYHYRVKASNAVDISTGSDLTFTTLGGLPIIVSVGDSLAPWPTTINTILYGSVNAVGSNTTVTFEYGTTTSYGTSLSTTPSVLTGGTNSYVSASITNSGLISATLYHFRAKAVNSFGTVYSNDATFFHN